MLQGTDRLERGFVARKNLAGVHRVAYDDHADAALLQRLLKRIAGFAAYRDDDVVNSAEDLFPFRRCV